MQEALRRIRWRMTRRGTAVPLIAVALFAALPATDALARSERVVVLEHLSSGRAAESAVRKAGGSVDRRLPLVGGFAARVPSGTVARLRRAPGVKSVSRDRRFHVLSETGAAADEGTSLASVRAAIGAPAAAMQGGGVDVALVDTGVAPVPALQGRVVDGADLSPEASDAGKRYLDGFGHGTHLAGIIAADGAGLTGVAPGSRVVNVKVADHNGETSLSQVLAGIDWTVRNRNRDGRNIRVLTLALGAEPQGSYRDDPLAFAVERAWAAGIAVVVAAGNGGEDIGALDSPAHDPYVIATAANDTMGTDDPADDRIADFSSRGRAERTPDVTAPGVRIISARAEGGLLDQMFPAAHVGDSGFRGSGTSQAAAVASGAAALLLAERPDLTADELKALLRSTARPVADPVEAAGSGQVAVDLAAGAATPRNARQSFAPATGRGPWRGQLALQLVEGDATGAAWDGTRWHGTRWHGTRWHGTRWHGTRWHGTRWHGDGWLGTRWHGTRWHGTRWHSDAWTGTRWHGTRWHSDTWTGTRWHIGTLSTTEDGA